MLKTSATFDGNYLKLMQGFMNEGLCIVAICLTYGKYTGEGPTDQEVPQNDMPTNLGSPLPHRVAICRELKEEFIVKLNTH